MGVRKWPTSLFNRVINLLLCRRNPCFDESESPTSSPVDNDPDSLLDLKQGFLITIVRGDVQTFLNLAREKGFIICDKNDRKVVAELVERPSPVREESSRFPEAPGQSTASRSDFDIPVHLHVEKTAASTSGQAAVFSAGSHSGQTQSRQGDPQPEYADIPSGGAYIPSGYAGNPFKEGDDSSPQKDAGIRSKDPNIPLEDADNTSSSSHADTTSELSADTSGKLSIKEAVDDIQTKELQVLLTSMQSNS